MFVYLPTYVSHSLRNMCLVYKKYRIWYNDFMDMLYIYHNSHIVIVVNCFYYCVEKTDTNIYYSSPKPLSFPP